MYLVGLTGGIGSGKSTVAAMLAERGCDLVDADRTAREIVEPGEPALDELVDRFGANILDGDGTLDRAALARVAFADDAARADLDRITHPRIAARIAEKVARLAASTRESPHIIVVDHPLLVETGQAARFDAVVAILASEECRIQRLLQRGMDEADVRRRLAAQASDDARRAAATHLIHNDEDLATLAAQVDAAYARLVSEARARE